MFFVVCFLFFVFRFLHSKCDKESGLCIDPLPVYFCGHYSFGPCTSQLINLICNMLGNMLNDLAEAIRRWTEKECLLYATFWFRPILSELIVAARESAEVNRKRAFSGPIKVVVTSPPHSRRHTGVDLVSGTTALLARFPASWASKIAP